MAYKKYIKRGGKLYGPYIYHSKRIDGKVVSEYHGPKKLDYKKFVFVGLGLIFLFVIIYLIASGHGRTGTGNVIWDLNANYQQGQPLSGKLSLSLQQGELLPSTSKVVFDNNGQVSEYALQDLVTDSTSEGIFYISGSSLSGEGTGYGIAGQKKVFPDVMFTLNVLSESQNTPVQDSSDSSGSSSSSDPSFTETPVETTATTTEDSIVDTDTEDVTDSSTESTTSSDSLGVVSTETNSDSSSSLSSSENSESAVPESQGSSDAGTEATTDTSAPLTGNVVSGIFGGIANFFLGLTPTGNAVIEYQNEIQGSVSSGESFTYDLQPGQRVELQPLSVFSGLKQLSDNKVHLDVIGNQVIITTDYVETSDGFGRDYLGGNKKNIAVDLDKVGFVPEEGNLRISLVSQGKEIISVDTVLQGEGSVSANKTIENPVVETTVSATQNESNEILQAPIQINQPLIQNVELTSEEKDVLSSEFGNSSVSIGEAKIKNGFIVVRYELGNYWIENSYPESLDNETLQKLMQQDRIKWLKDLAKKFSVVSEDAGQTIAVEGNFSDDF